MQDVERHEVQELIQRGAQVVDVLPRDEFDEDHLPGAVNMPLPAVETAASTKLDKSRPVLVYCWDSA